MENDRISWLADSVSVGLARMRYDGVGLKIEYANKGLYDILHCSEEEYAKKYDNYYNAVILPKDWEKMRVAVERCINEWTELEAEYSVIDANGRIG